VGAIFDKYEPMALGDGGKRIHITRTAGEMDNEKCPRSFGDTCLYMSRVYVKCRRFNVHQNRLCTRVNDRVYRRTEGHGCRDNLIARPDTRSHQAKVKSGGAGIHGYRMACALVIAKLALEPSHFRTGSKPTCLQAVEDLLLLFSADQRRAED
jgi:hypothetical protein